MKYVHAVKEGVQYHWSLKLLQKNNRPRLNKIACCCEYMNSIFCHFYYSDENKNEQNISN